MSHTPHELTEEFPQKADAIHRLRESDAHFRRLTDEYHEVNRAIHRAETRSEPTTEAHEEEMRRTRAHLKDQIARALG
jgi:uncharacterized protein YdcH (DUF465 family)